ncbi:phospholipase A2 inhibitor and Ly6/PLAUR domain-containing protein-like [Lepidochelys kempii]|uniref:phospholipase A2 inhibitor and Ly6/PLAUR domain-containing protein-like n=1 Tax=Lepidochelys kempii TaxID=8472 RepID=UPI003C6EC103
MVCTEKGFFQPPGSTLQCEVCASEEQSCAGPLQLCAPSEGTCVTVVAEFRLERNSFSYTGKSCLEPKNCEPGPFSLTYAHNVTVRVNIACCDTDGCNAGAIPGDIKLRMTAAGCGSPGACVKRALVKKYAQGVPEILSQAKCYPAPRAGGGIGEP